MTTDEADKVEPVIGRYRFLSAYKVFNLGLKLFGILTLRHLTLQLRKFGGASLKDPFKSLLFYLYSCPVPRFGPKAMSPPDPPTMRWWRPPRPIP